MRCALSEETLDGGGARLSILPWKILRLLSWESEMRKLSVHAATKWLCLKPHKFNNVPNTSGGRLCCEGTSLTSSIKRVYRHSQSFIALFYIWGIVLFKQTRIFWNKGTSSTPEMPVHDIKLRLCYIITAATVTGPVLVSDAIHSERYTGHILISFFFLI